MKSGRTFVYGDFFWGKKQTRLPPPPGWQPFALEILREFSTTELIGKLYVRSGNSWLPATRVALQQYNWYKLASPGLSRFLRFDMEGSGVWQVQHFREESDDTGPYLAVAMKFGEPKSSSG